MFSQLISVRHPNHELVVDVTRSGGFGREYQLLVEPVLPEQSAIRVGISAPLISPDFQMPQFHPDNRSLQSIQSAVDSQYFGVILAAAAMHSQEPYSSRQFSIVRSDEPAIPGATQVFRREEAETIDDANIPDFTIVADASQRLSGILNHRDTVVVGQLHDRLHRGGQAVEVYGQNRLRGWANGLGDLVRIDVECTRIDVDEDRFCPETCNRTGRCDKSKGRRDDFVVAANSDGHQSEQECVRSRSASDGEATADIVRYL